MIRNGFDYTASEFRRLVYSEGEGVAEQEEGDHLLNPEIRHDIDGIKWKDAAVLIPVVDYGDEARVILTKRTENLRSHSGQIAFPGGGIDADDKSPEDAALREAYEEIGLDPQFVEAVGRLPTYLTGTGFRIKPVLSVVRPGFTLVPNPDEVEAIFEVPLQFLMTKTNFQHGSLMLNGSERHFYEIPYGDRRIWGITAGIIRSIFERFYE